MQRASGEPRYPVRMVMKRTGLTADLLRAWERRYGVVQPQRSAGGQRLYSEDDIVRLGLLKRATAAGHSIGEIASLDAAALEALVEPAVRSDAGPPDAAIESIVASALGATERLDANGVEAALKRGLLALGGSALIEQVIARFLRRVGERWHAGTLSPAHEHLASAAVRRVIGWTTDAYSVGPRAPRLLVATPAQEHHEFGALLAAAAALEEGWNVIYLGPNLPGADIAAAATQVGARAVALSAVYANGGSGLDGIRETAGALPRGIPLLVGGAAAEAHADSLGSEVRLLPDMVSLRRVLRSLRAEPRQPGVTSGEQKTSDEG